VKNGCGTARDAVQAQITAELGISEATARRACRELGRLGLIRLVPGHGYYPGTRP
jgi:DNA-binding GntR family transcriptional regulator